jgi:hypothetical protein
VKEKPEDTRTSVLPVSRPLKADPIPIDSMEKVPAGSSAETQSDAMRVLTSRGRLREVRAVRRGKLAVIRGEAPSVLELKDSLTLAADLDAGPPCSSTMIAEPGGTSTLLSRE